MSKKIRILYFASLAERLGCANETIEVPETIATVADLKALLAERHTPWHSGTDTKLLQAVNQDLVQPAHPILDGDEVAFFPPVTGG